MPIQIDDDNVDVYAKYSTAKILKALALLLLDQINDLRDYQGKSQVTPAQFKNALVNKVKNIS